MVKLLLERGDINPDSSDTSRLTPLSRAVMSGQIAVVRSIRNAILTQQISISDARAREEVEIGPVSQRKDTTLDTGHPTTEAILLPPSDHSPSSQLEVPSTPVLTPTPTSDNAPDLAIMQPLGLLKRRRAIRPVARRSMLKYSHPS
ncbi:hypothetical protein HOY82DRAFT_605439 [Tuber indicum]|nr:hypothetical protein HOY82DRAFT_605439 [Tuber indicum]